MLPQVKGTSTDLGNDLEKDVRKSYDMWLNIVEREPRKIWNYDGEKEVGRK